MKIMKQKGTKDIILNESSTWQYIEKNIREVCKVYSASEIRTPVFEATELFLRGVGNETDIVNKEMYTFLDKAGRSITLRPELTAGVVRAYIENGLSSVTSPLKLWYIGNMYRYEKMQKGRYREFSQFGVEIFGCDSYLADIEAICMSYNLLKRINLVNKVTLNINSIGCNMCRTKYIQNLKEYILPNLDNMCETCKVRFEKNPLRILDCKEDHCQEILLNAPLITDSLCSDCKDDFSNVLNMLKSLNIDFEVNKKIVRGLDYYNKTVFEYTSKDLDLAIGGGGRYDALVGILGGNDTPAVGFALGIDRIALLLKNYSLDTNLNANIDLYFAIIDKSGYAKAINIANILREYGFIVETDICERSFKSQLKYADKINANYVCIIGEEEINNNKCVIKNMKSGKQNITAMESKDIIELLKKGV
ncbi:MAG: histidine--tRNA ligase [Clostridia bacterium]